MKYFFLKISFIIYQILCSIIFGGIWDSILIIHYFNNNSKSDCFCILCLLFYLFNYFSEILCCVFSGKINSGHFFLFSISIFSRHFYPKQLTVHSDYTFVCQYVCSLGIEPTNFALTNTMLYHWATGTFGKYSLKITSIIVVLVVVNKNFYFDGLLWRPLEVSLCLIWYDISFICIFFVYCIFVFFKCNGQRLMKWLTKCIF